MTTPSLFSRRQQEVRRNLDLAIAYEARALECDDLGSKKRAEAWRYSAACRLVQAEKEQALVEAMQRLQTPESFEQEGIEIVVSEPVKVVVMMKVKRCRRAPSNVRQLEMLEAACVA